MTRSPSPAVTLDEAVAASPVLSRLAQASSTSRRLLDNVSFLIPSSLRPQVTAGPYTAGDWCLLVADNAAAAKLRQLLPAIQAHLRSRGEEVSAIRLRVQTARY